MVPECGVTFAAEETEGQSMSANDAKTRKVYNARQVVKHFVMPFTEGEKTPLTLQHRLAHPLPQCVFCHRIWPYEKVSESGPCTPRKTRAAHVCAAQQSGHQVV